MTSHEDIEQCLRRLAEEQRLADDAPSFEVGELHRQKVALYQVRLAVLTGMPSPERISVRGF